MSVCESTRNLAMENLHRGAELGEASVLHLGVCSDCRLFVERTQRMSASVYADEPTAAEILRLRVRLGSGIAGLGSSRPTYTRRPRWQFALAASFVLLSGTVVAATGGERLLEVVGLSSNEQPSETPAEVKTKPRAPRKAAPAPAAEPEASIDVEALALEVEEPSAPAPRARAQHPKAEAKWADVAKSLRSKNYDKAQRSLGELSQSGDAVERDTARLSLAQLWLQQGKTAQARQLLRELSVSGASPFIRKRAGELLP